MHPMTEGEVIGQIFSQSIGKSKKAMVNYHYKSFTVAF